MPKSSNSKFFVYIFWILLFVVGYYGFNTFTQNRNNPNQTPQTQINQRGQHIVYLQANPNHAYIVNGYINQYPVTFLVDTGASSVVIPHAIAQNIGLHRGQAYDAYTANGVITVYDTTVDNLSIGNISLSNIRASINPAEEGKQVLLGMSALKKLEFQYKNNTLILIQNK